MESKKEVVEKLMEMCSDNRFQIIEKAKAHLLEGTNIDTSPEEMKVLDNFLFRCWQMGWLDKYDDSKSKNVVGTLKFPTIQEMAQEIAKKALDEYEYEGKSIRQWVEVLKDYDDKQTTLERIVGRLEEEILETLSDCGDDWFTSEKINEAIEIVKEEGGLND